MKFKIGDKARVKANELAGNIGVVTQIIDTPQSVDVTVEFDGAPVGFDETELDHP